MIRPLALTLLLALSIASAGAQGAASAANRRDQQFVTGPAQALLARCPFAPGYLYGYDDGYHEGDLDFQLARGRRDFRQSKRYRAGVPESFRPAKADRTQFRLGYRSGFAAGYFDSIAGRRYRGFAQVQVATAKLAQPRVSSAGSFALSFLRGYEDGLKGGQVLAAMDADYALPDNPCSVPGLDCEAYARGFAMGFPDGYLQAGDVPPSPRELQAMRASGVQTAAVEGSH